MIQSEPPTNSRKLKQHHRQRRAMINLQKY